MGSPIRMASETDLSNHTPFEMLKTGMPSKRNLILPIMTGIPNNLLDLRDEVVRQLSPGFLIGIKFLSLTIRPMQQIRLSSTTNLSDVNDGQGVGDSRFQTRRKNILRYSHNFERLKTTSAAISHKVASSGIQSKHIVDDVGAASHVHVHGDGG